MDLIVVRNRGIDTPSGGLLGSVPSDVSQRASCDVLILHTMKGGPRNPREQR
jgi:nucleotide-binding universal stress UspA family protein